MQQRPGRARSPRRRNSLSLYVDALQESGRYTFHRDDAAKALDSTPIALKNALRRLVAKRRLASPRRGFYVIVPLEYRRPGVPPAAWFIDDLMRVAERKPYYVGLLSAAALYGAAHHAPQEFEVVTNAVVRPITLGSLRVRFFKKVHIEKTATVPTKTPTGSMKVSTPEATALDLVRYAPRVGHLGNVATVLSELAERLDPAKLLDAADADVEIPCVQRLGYLLELVGRKGLAKPLAKWLGPHQPRIALLRPGSPAEGKPVNERWRLVVNEDVEPET